MAVRDERSSWRDLAFSKMHRGLPERLYFTDVDCLEYRHGREGVALIETKRRTLRRGADPTPVLLGEHNSQRMVLADLGNRTDIPAFCVTYAYEDGDDEVYPQRRLPGLRPPLYSTWRFFIQPLNDLAWMFNPGGWVDREGYVKFLDSL